MRKIIDVILFCLISSAALFSQNNITFAFTSKFQSQFEVIVEDGLEYGGAARLSHVTRNLRLTSDRFILLDTGDHFAGRFYRQNRGVPDVELMNDFRYDAMLVGSSELSMGEDIFDDWAKYARFPLVISNLIAPPQCKICRHIVSYTTIDRVSLTVGVFALLPGDLEAYGRLPDAIGIDTDYVSVAREIVDILSEKSDIIVLLSQLDIESNERLASEVCEIDLIFVNDWAGYGDEPMVIENEAGCITIIGYAGSRGKKLGVVKTTWDDAGGMEDFSWQPIELTDFSPIDPEIH
ncbi:MAG TPA: bifunctional metallophosphatase/5'-nucleotidase [candidate division Zixibacteria bacterium]|nr:bifunctional metallophosphatase/5'-nucleotidase [candidate division Zixibacteria bacterium]